MSNLMLSTDACELHATAGPAQACPAELDSLDGASSEDSDLHRFHQWSVILGQRGV